jgi:polysaccharide biosynthesis protein PslG
MFVTTMRGGRNFQCRKLVQTALGAIVSGLCVVALISTPTSQRHRQVVTDDVANLSISATTLGFADSQIYYYDDAQVTATVQKWVANNIRTVRIGIPWNGVEAVKDQLDWSRSDRLVNAAAAANISVIACITSTPRWAMAPGSTLPHGRPASPEVYGVFTAKVAERYKGKIAAYEIWNEPNGFIGYSPAPNPAGYTDLLKAAYPRIKAVDSAAIVVGGVLGSGMTWGNLTINPVTFLSQMYASGAAPFFDALSYHPYSYAMKFSAGMLQFESPLDQLVRMRRVMLQQGDGAKKIWVTEYGLPTSRVTEPVQAAFLSDMISTWRELPYAGPLMIYTTRDHNSNSANDEERFGVYRSDWTPKPAQKIVESPPGTSAVFQRFSANTDPSLGEVLSPVYAATPKIWVQQRTLGTLWETAPGNFLVSPTPVADLARSQKATPTTTFTDGYQDFVNWQRFRIWYSPETGAHWGSAEFAKKWVPALGLATSSEKWVNGATRVTFQRGVMTWRPFVGVKVYLSQ